MSCFTTALRAKTFQLSQLPLKARALSQMAALGAAPSKRKWYKISTFEIVDLAEMFWVAVNWVCPLSSGARRLAPT